MLPLIVYIPMGWVIPNTFWKCGEIAGAYIPQTQTVYICEGQGEFIKQHEIGHHIWYTELTDEQRATYKKEFERDKKRGRSYFYDDYSMTNELEDFADNYAKKETKQNFKIQRRINLINNFLNHD